MDYTNGKKVLKGFLNVWEQAFCLTILDFYISTKLQIKILDKEHPP